ncbi:MULTISPECIES: hypothetical protein [Chromobacterium]|uniref:hypothetical protein n=1 Tax=Chromobacterium TaxID=535 RepID=UPI0011AEC365|nr:MULTISPECIES: hypothetical protein [Chromobacterium]MCD0491268.1 hypothetical protein [Chromobacterium violaceum]
MSLEGKIAELVTATNGLISTFIGKRQEIDKAVERAVATIPQNKRTYYVDALSGSDSNVGGKENPLASMQKALDLTPVGGVCDVVLLEDYVLKKSINVDGRYLWLRSIADRQPRVRLLVDYYPGNMESVLGRFGCFRGGQVEINSVDIVLPSAKGVTPIPPNSHSNSLVNSAMNGGQSIVSLKLNLCNVIAPDDFIGSLIGCPTSFLVLQCNGVGFPENFGGKYIHQVAAKTDPATLVNARTNLKNL